MKNSITSYFIWFTEKLLYQKIDDNFNEFKNTWYYDNMQYTFVSQ